MNKMGYVHAAAERLNIAIHEHTSAVSDGSFFAKDDLTCHTACKKRRYG